MVNTATAGQEPEAGPGSACTPRPGAPTQETYQVFPRPPWTQDQSRYLKHSNTPLTLPHSCHGLKKAREDWRSKLGLCPFYATLQKHWHFKPPSKYFRNNHKWKDFLHLTAQMPGTMTAEGTAQSSCLRAAPRASFGQMTLHSHKLTEIVHIWPWGIYSGFTVGRTS